MELPRELVVDHRKREVRKAMRFKRREVRRAQAREAEIWNNAQRKAAHRARLTCEPNGNC